MWPHKPIKEVQITSYDYKTIYPIIKSCKQYFYKSAEILIQYCQKLFNVKN